MFFVSRKPVSGGVIGGGRIGVSVNAKNRNKATISNANMEPSNSNAPHGAQKIKRLDTPCRIHLHSRRHRLADADGVCCKYAIDGLIHAKILTNDSPKEVEEVSYSQEKIPKAEVEETIITIEWRNHEA